jgi:hypothetical protein
VEEGEEKTDGEERRYRSRGEKKGFERRKIDSQCFATLMPTMALKKMTRLEI